jgi:hypothetical protein
VPTEQEAYEELQAYTLARGDATFIHQHVVDAWTAQHADAHTKPIGLAFALVGLHLHLDRGYTGRQVQRVHMILSGRSKTWPSFTLPVSRGAITATQVMAAMAGVERDKAIDDWGASVWTAFGECHHAVAQLLKQHDIT